jgi:hypothetical protein
VGSISRTFEADYAIAADPFGSGSKVLRRRKPRNAKVPSTFQTRYNQTRGGSEMNSLSNTSILGSSVAALSETDPNDYISNHLLIHHRATLPGPLKAEYGKIIDALNDRKHGRDELLEHQEPVRTWHEGCPSNKPSNFILKFA